MPYSAEDMTVAGLAGALALACGTDPTTAKLISEAAAYHDVGKYRIDRRILNKPVGLSPCEYKAMKAHTIWGANILRRLPGELGEMARTIALFHHERYDGAGYWGKRVNDNPYFVHIVTVCDVYTALISWRSYKRAWTKDEALNYISTQAGKQFSPILAHIFIKLMREQNGETAFFDFVAAQ